MSNILESKTIQLQIIEKILQDSIFKISDLDLLEFSSAFRIDGGITKFVENIIKAESWHQAKLTELHAIATSQSDTVSRKEKEDAQQTLDYIEIRKKRLENLLFRLQSYADKLRSHEDKSF